ncbi:MAG TPA: VOC family protein [Actinomycetota bacterium]|jgi:catechol 2,3-dioxygenase-like lactoylglutathione lyase family enzyme|nr:VOC family protein [Actinomycetota bacterium]
MLTDARTHTTLPVEDPARARAFYANQLGLEPVSESLGGNFYETGGTRFLLFPTQGRPSGTHTQMGFVVDNVEATVAALKERGVEFEEYDFPAFDKATSIAQTGSVRSAWFKDSEGNLLGVVQLSE